MRKIFFIAFFCLILSGCGNRGEKYEIIGNALDSQIKITIYSDNISDKDANEILENAMNLCVEYENLFSRTTDTTPIYLLNENKVLDVASLERGNEIKEVINKSFEFSELSDGLFDITIAPVVDLWGSFGNHVNTEHHVPAEEDLTNALKSVSYENIIIDGDIISLENNSKIDLGGIAKGYIADKIKEYLLSSNINSGLIYLGGNILTIGVKDDGEPFKLGLVRPFDSNNSYIGIIDVKDKSVVTSGIYERYFEKDGTIYHHILNPKTGMPENNGISAVTVISDKSVDGDGLTTTFFLMGIEKALEIANNMDGIDVLFILENDEIVTTDGFIEKYNYVKN